MLTVPRSIFKSSTRDLSHPTLVVAILRTRLFEGRCRKCMAMTRGLLLPEDIGQGGQRPLQHGF